MKLVVVIPALNESNTIARVVEGVPDAVPGVDEVESVVVDDGSTDGTAELAAAAGAAVVSHASPRGVGAAFRTGLSAALERGAGVIVNVDGDGQFDPADIPALVRPIVDGEADVVTCSRFARKDLAPKMPWIKRAGNRLVCAVVNWVTGERFTDVSCGFRAYSREAALRLNLFGDFTYTQETFIELAGEHARICEVPLRVRGVREFGKSRVASNLLGYAARSSAIMLRAARDLNPMKFFGLLGLGVFAVGCALGAFVLGHWLATGHTSPYARVLTGSAVGLILGFLLLVLALIADMLGRQRRISEELLYLRRKQAVERAERDVSGSEGS
ncbi:MAG: glycosyltransferase family 2 protein [Planctomycetota bacterium]